MNESTLKHGGIFARMNSVTAQKTRSCSAQIHFQNIFEMRL